MAVGTFIGKCIVRFYAVDIGQSVGELVGAAVAECCGRTEIDAVVLIQVAF